MKAYLITTAVLFALLAVLHVARLTEIWRRLPTDPWFVAGVGVITLLSGGLSLWALALLRPRRPPQG